MAVPSIPDLQVFIADNVTNTSAKAIWKESTNAISYRFEASLYESFTAPSNAFSDFISGYPKETTLLEEVMDGLRPGSLIYVRVKALNGLEESDYSRVQKVVTVPNPAQAWTAQNITSTSFRISINKPTGTTFWLLDVTKNIHNFSPTLPTYEQLKITESNFEVTGLEPDTSYTYRVIAANEYGEAFTYSQNVGLTTLPSAFEIPKNIKTNRVQDESFEIVFDPVIGATKYFLSVSVDNFGTFLPGYNQKEITANSEVVIANPETRYWFKVKAQGVSSADLSSFSEVGQVLTPPHAPTDLAFTGAPSSPSNYELFGFGLTCTNPADFTKSGKTKYFIDVALDKDFTQLAVSFTDSEIYQDFLIEDESAVSVLIGLYISMDRGNTYYARARVGSENSSGMSSNYSNIATITTAYEFPPTPANLALEGVRQNAIEVSWSSVPLFEGGIPRADLIRLELLESKTNQLIRQLDFSELDITSHAFVTNVLPDTEYKVKVSYRNPTGFGAANELGGIQTLSSVAPPIATSPTGTKLINNSTGGYNVEFEIHWREPQAFYGSSLTQDPVNEQFEFLLYVSDDYFATIPLPIIVDKSPEIIVNTARNFVHVVTLPANVPVYQYRIRARRKDVGGYSTEFSNTIQVNVPLPAPKALPATVITETSFVANWEQYPLLATIQLFAYEIGYDFLQGLNPNYSLTNSDTAYNVENLKPGTLYAYYLRTQFNGQTSEVSQLMYVRTQGKPALAPGPTALPASNITETSFQANWEDYLGELAYKIVIEKVGDNSFNKSTILAEGETNWAVSDLGPGEKYSYYLIAFFPEGESDKSNQITATTTGSLKPLPAVQNLIVYSVGSTYGTLDWQYYPGADGFFVFVKHKGEDEIGYENGKLFPTTQGAIKITGLVEGTTYDIYVSAEHEGVISPPSNIVTITTKGRVNIKNPISTNELFYYPVINSLPFIEVNPPLFPVECVGRPQGGGNRLFVDKVVAGITPDDYFHPLSQVLQDVITIQFHSLSDIAVIRIIEYRTRIIKSEETIFPWPSKPTLFQFQIKSWELPLGKYQVEIIASDFRVLNDNQLPITLPWERTLISEPFEVKKNAKDTLLIQYTNTENNRNQTGIDYSTDIIHGIRVQGSLDEFPSQVEETSVKNTNGIPELVSGQATSRIRLIIKNSPAYVHEIIRRAILSDSFFVGGIEFKRGGAYSYTAPGKVFFTSGNATLVLANQARAFTNNP